MREVEMQRELSSRVGPMPSAAPSEITAATHCRAITGPAVRGTVICCHTVVWCGLQQRSLTPQSAPSSASQPASARTAPPSAAPDEFSAHFARITAVRRHGANAIVRAAASPSALRWSGRTGCG